MVNVGKDAPQIVGVAVPTMQKRVRLYRTQDLPNCSSPLLRPSG
jgi:hypothetical protein